MGGWWSDNSGSEGDEITEVLTQNPYRYPAKGGTYFGSHFIMGGERFETPQPEQYLFGDNSDLNFLGGKPVPFPYPAPGTNEPTKALKALIYIRKETLKFVRVPDSKSYNIEFVFDADCRCQITIMYFCREELTPAGVVYRPQDPKLNSEPIQFKAGAAQVFTNPEHSFTPSVHSETDLSYDFDSEVYPVVIHCVALEGDEQSHSTTAVVDKHSQDIYTLKPLKQKLFVDGLCYLLQEIYGIENKHGSSGDGCGDDDSQNAECVVCLSEMRDTIILPCKHLCLCHSCADSLRYQASSCPICRAPFRALLQIRAVYKVPPAPIEYPAIPSDMPVVQMNTIPGFEMVPLLEALNGPFKPSDVSQATATMAIQAAKVLTNADIGDNGKFDSTLVENTKNFPEPIAMKVMVAPVIQQQQAPLEKATDEEEGNDEDDIVEDENGCEDLEDENSAKQMETGIQSESCTPVGISRHVIPRQRIGTSLPTTPNLTVVSTNGTTAISTRSSGDSFTSSASSTKQLLGGSVLDRQDKDPKENSNRSDE